MQFRKNKAGLQVSPRAFMLSCIHCAVMSRPQIYKTDDGVKCNSVQTFLSPSALLWTKVFIFSKKCVCMTTEPHSSAMDNQVPEHCQHLICLPVGTRGQRQPSANQLQSEKCGGERAAPFTPPGGWPCLYLLLGSWKQSEGLTVCIQRWPEPCLRGGMQSGDACLPGRKCWNLIITPSLSREINEETEKKKKNPSLPPHTHRHLTDTRFNTKNVHNKCRCRSINPLLKA